MRRPYLGTVTELSRTKPSLISVRATNIIRKSGINNLNENEFWTILQILPLCAELVLPIVSEALTIFQSLLSHHTDILDSAEEKDNKEDDLQIK